MFVKIQVVIDTAEPVKLADIRYWQLRRNCADTEESFGRRRGYLGFITTRHRSRPAGHDAVGRIRGLTSHDSLKWRTHNGLFRNFSQHMVRSGERY